MCESCALTIKERECGLGVQIGAILVDDECDADAGKDAAGET